MADKIDRQLTHRGAARSVTALAAMLAHEIKNPLSGIRGAAQLLEQSAADEDRALTRLICDGDRPHRQAGRPHGGLRRRAAGRARAGQHPRRARSRETAGAIGLRPAYQIRRGLRSVAAAGARQSRPADPGLPQSRQERRRGDRRERDRRRDPSDHGVPARRAPVGAGQQNARVAAAGILRQGQRSRRARRPAAASVRSVRHHQADRHRASVLRWSPRSSAIMAASSNANRNRATPSSAS